MKKSNQGGKTMNIVGWVIARTNASLSPPVKVASTPEFTRPLNSPPLPSPERCDLIRAFRSRGRAPRALRAAEASSVIML